MLILHSLLSPPSIHPPVHLSFNHFCCFFSPNFLPALIFLQYLLLTLHPYVLFVLTASSLTSLNLLHPPLRDRRSFKNCE